MKLLKSIFKIPSTMRVTKEKISRAKLHNFFKSPQAVKKVYSV